jgi:hypothetical protein
MDQNYTKKIIKKLYIYIYGLVQLESFTSQNILLLRNLYIHIRNMVYQIYVCLNIILSYLTNFEA